MKRFWKRLTGYHWIAILLVMLFVGTFINESPYSPQNLPSTRAMNLYHHMRSVLNDRLLLKDSHSYFLVEYYYDDNLWLDRIDRWGILQGWHKWKVLLEIGVTNEAAIDEFLASWKGEKWDKLVKVPSDCSIAKQEEFIGRAYELDWGPGVEFCGYTDNRNNFPRKSPPDRELTWPRLGAFVRLPFGTSAEDAASWEEMPQQLKDLAEEMGVPEEIIVWDAPTIREGPSEDDAPADTPLSEEVTPPEPDHAGGANLPPHGEELNPDFGWGPEEERVNQVTRAVQDGLLAQLPETSYSYLSIYEDGSEVVLKIGVVDEPAVDACLAAWTGEKWDRLVKEPALYSRAMRAEFVEKAQQLDFGPDAKVTIGTFPSLWSDEKVVFGVMILLPESYAAGEEPNPWETAMPQQLADLAKEMDIPEDVIDYSFAYIIDPEPLPGSEPPVG